MAVTNNAEGAATNFVTADGNFMPLAFMYFARTVAKMAGQHDDFGNDQFGNAAGI